MKKIKLSKGLLLTGLLLATALTACDTNSSNTSSMLETSKSIETNSITENTTPTTNIEDNNSSNTNTNTTETNNNDDTNNDKVILNKVGYTEGAYVTFNLDNKKLNDASVSYSKDNGITWTNIDKELIRINNGTARADIIGLSAGNYKIKVDNGINSEVSDITVSKDDRSGYAHFNNTNGVGAYKNDGTLKDNAIVVYVTDSNKNTVTATVNGQEHTGLVDIVKAATNSNEALDVRIIGEIQTQQWNNKTHGKGNTSDRQANLDETFKEVNWEETTENELKNPGALRSSNYYKISEADIIKYGINSMSDDEALGITHLDGLTNNILKDIEVSNGRQEYDSYYNELDVRNGNNITIEGIGDDAKIFQWGFCFNQCNSIEVKNIEFSAYTEDAIGIQGSNKDVTLYSDYWIHNCTFNSGVNNWDVCYENDKTDGDGSTDLKSAHDLTISYCRYNGTHKTALIGSSSSSYQYNVTFHHNFYNKCGSRLPFTRNTNFHIYNCYYKESTGTNMQIESNAYAFIEGCYFDTQNTFTNNGGVIKLYKNTIVGNSSVTGLNINYVDKRTYPVANNCMADQINDYSSFDTNINQFYYDSVNNITKVDLMMHSDEVKDYIPTVAGAGLNTVIDYSKNFIEQNEAYVDTTITAAYSESVPTIPGLYGQVLEYDLDSAGKAITSTERIVELSTTNTVKENNGQITVTDNSNDKTTVGFKMFDSTNIYSTGTHSYSFTITFGNEIGTKWNMVRFLDNNGNEVLSIRMASDSKKMAYTLDGSTEVIISTSSFSGNKSYDISLTINYDNNTATLSIGDNTATISDFDVQSINGLKLFTNIGNKRSFTIDNIVIE